jgi:hypothetical protein
MTTLPKIRYNKNLMQEDPSVKLRSKLGITIVSEAQV